MPPAFGSALTPMNSQRSRADRAAFAASGELLQLFTELSYLISDYGIALKSLCNLLEHSFTRVAADNSRLQNGRTNNSRVAAQTGLSRAAIRRLLNDELLIPGLVDRTPLARVVNGWRTDRQFLDRFGKPRPLKISGKNDSFARLAKKYGGDIPPRAILDELRRRGSVTNDAMNGRLRLRKDPAGRNLGDLKTRLQDTTKRIRSLRKL